MFKNLSKHNTQCKKKIREYLFPKGSTYILGQKCLGSTFKQGNEYRGSILVRECFWAVTSARFASDRQEVKPARPMSGTGEISISGAMMIDNVYDLPHCPGDFG